ncbi:EF-P lysine aminoacylase GenX [Dissulfurirhabdus thermomarina]|uniref:EF-P lysine aminoacylase GenX n=1 Tax=Dissulfurirhabdus thermomarina TaxID=1765737 RepID=A0A6N9TR00_DISTH|nr:EF-P lysine aminoacylase EpmA [Dissulfurirhabdus thermomarina]NDY41867.1 EF-P lysine aminoacylase GenX [Dissulfurirhabdus thermomarina]NMX22568.1 EF-P lysine aminoacylase GenX [Dissulfurirhabdus thermomarina]
MRRRRLILRAQVVEALRAWFRSRGFVEVQTPILVGAPAPEPEIDAFAVAGAGYLAPSPELAMKRLLAEGFDRIFQLGPVFRRGERGGRHLPEFTMLEWYRAGADYHALMADCEAVLPVAARAAGHPGTEVHFGGRVVDLAPPYPRLPVREAFRRLAGWEPGADPDPWRFDHDMVERVEPALDAGRPVFLVDYPASRAALARLKPGDPAVAERVELYAGGLELANGFSELTDPAEQRRRFARDRERRRRAGLDPYPMPEAFLEALGAVPACAGMALGVDRLLMLLLDCPEIDGVVAFAPGAA